MGYNLLLRVPLQVLKMCCESTKSHIMFDNLSSETCKRPYYCQKRIHFFNLTLFFFNPISKSRAVRSLSTYTLETQPIDCSPALFSIIDICIVCQRCEKL